MGDLTCNNVAIRASSMRVPRQRYAHCNPTTNAEIVPSVPVDLTASKLGSNPKDPIVSVTTPVTKATLTILPEFLTRFTMLDAKPRWFAGVALNIALELGE